MVRKNEYKLNKKVNESILKKCGFRKEHGDCYTLKHFLYEKYVSLNILVMLDDLSLTVTVTDDGDSDGGNKITTTRTITIKVVE